MKVTFVNNSVSGVHWKLGNFDLHIPGHTTVTPKDGVPDSLVEKVRSYLQKYHPAIVMTEERAMEVVEPKPEAADLEQKLAGPIVEVPHESESGQVEVESGVQKPEETGDQVETQESAEGDESDEDQADNSEAGEDASETSDPASEQPQSVESEDAKTPVAPVAPAVQAVAPARKDKGKNRRNR